MRLKHAVMSYAAAALAMASCSDNAVLPGAPSGSTVISATIDSEDTQSRTCVDMNDTGHGYLGLLWNPSDSIGVFGKKGTKNALFRCTATANAAKADFSGDMNDGDTPYRAYYPYSAENAGADMTDLRGRVLDVQPYDAATGRLCCDYKYGSPRSGSTTEFSFRHIFSLLQIDINAEGTVLDGEKIERIDIAVAAPDGTPRAIAGAFSFNAVNGSWRDVTDHSGNVRMIWSGTPALNGQLTGFVTVMPDVLSGDTFTITVVTDAHVASFRAESKIAFAGGSAYNLPLALSRFASDAETYGWSVAERPVIKSFRFTAAANAGKILDNKLVWNSSDNPQFDSAPAVDATIGASEISAFIPYLYDFTLVPEFAASAGATASVNGQPQTSGTTAVDFSKPVVYTVSVDGDTRDYTVNVKNTGLPVVVIEQSKSGDFSEEKTGGFLGIGGTVVNKFVNFMVRGKGTEWVVDDRMTVYNADGSVDMPTAFCGVRLRGNTSKAYPKKPFAVKMTSKQAVLGMPAHKRWVLLANWLDHSMIRNTVAFDVAHAVERAWQSGDIEQGIPWNVHGRNVELVVDGHHVGNYYLCEQIKINKKRLNIRDAYEDVLNPTFETCGYLLELDNNYDENYKFITSKASVPFMFKDDLPDTEIFNKVKAKIQGIEDNLASGNYSAAYNDLDINTVIDQWIIWELTMNREFVEPRSVYYFMDGNGKLCAGPVWDFDRGTFQNTANAASQGSDRVKPYNEWIYWIGSPKAGLSDPSKNASSVWYPYLFKDPVFCQAVQARWKVIYPYLQAVEGEIRAYAAAMQASYDVDSSMWPTDKAAVQKHKSGFKDWSGDENIASFADVVDNLAKCYTNRLEGMNTLITSGKFVK